MWYEGHKSCVSTCFASHKQAQHGSKPIILIPMDSFKSVPIYHHQTGNAGVNQKYKVLVLPDATDRVKEELVAHIFPVRTHMLV